MGEIKIQFNLTPVLLVALLLLILGIISFNTFIYVVLAIIISGIVLFIAVIFLFGR